MSIEKTIADLTAAVQNLTLALTQGKSALPNTGAINTATVSAPAAAPQAPQMPAPPVFQAPAPAAPPPMFQAPAPAAAPAGPAAPFTDGAGLIAYVMAAYKEMGPTKGAGIQGVLTQLGYQNINDVKPEHYGALFQGVEALKRG